MPLENNNILNDNDAETRLENDNSKDLKLVDDDATERDIQLGSDGNRLADGIRQLAHKDEYIDES